MNDSTNYQINATFVLDKVCRICLEESTPLISIFASLEINQFEVTTITFKEILTRLVADPISDDNTPNSLCLNCVAQLKSVYEFILKYEQTVNYLKSLQFVDNDEQFEQKNIFEEYAEVKVEETELVEECQVEPPPPPPTKKKKKIRKVPVKPVQQQSSKPANSKEKYHICPICTQEFTALELREHAHTHKGLKKYLSIPENKKVKPTTKFYTKRNVTNPNVSLFNLKEIIHKCVYCNEEYKTDTLRLHLDAHRKQNEFQCNICDRVFRRVNHLNIHKIKHLKEYPFKCEHCGKGFVIKANYDCHKLIHTDKELPHECKFCYKRFSNPEHLNRHQIIHTENITYSVKYKVCKCSHCLKTFKDKDEMNQHECVPLQTTPKYSCKLCKKIFNVSNGLYNHNRNVHRRKGKKTLCSVCGSYVANIYHHMMRHKGEKPFQCNQCEKKFSSRSQLKQHLLVHSGLKPYVCSICAKAFNNLYNLQVHERMHKGNRCHICPVCNKGFLEKSYLKKHMNIHARVD